MEGINGKCMMNLDYVNNAHGTNYLLAVVVVVVLSTIAVMLAQLYPLRGIHQAVHQNSTDV